MNSHGIAGSSSPLESRLKMRLKPGSCVHHSCLLHVIYLWAWMGKTQNPYPSDTVTAGSDYLWNLGSACVLEDENIHKPSKHKGRLTQRKHPAAVHSRCTVILLVAEEAGGEGRQNWATPAAVTQGGKNTSLRSENREWVWWAGLPTLFSSPSALKKPAGQKVFLGGTAD